MALTLAALDTHASPSLTGLHARVRLGDGTEITALAACVGLGAADSTLQLRDASGPLELIWRWEPAQAGLWLQLEVRNVGPTAIAVDRLVPLATAAPAGRLDPAAPIADWAFYQHGWMSWAPTLVRRVLGPDRLVVPEGDPYYQPHNLPQRPRALTALSSNDVTLVGTAAQAWLFGFERAQGCLNHFALETDRGEFARFEAICDPQIALRLAPGDRYASPRCWIAFGEPEALLERYATLSAPNIPLGESRAGWCSWYYYFGGNDANDVLADLAAMQARPQGQGLDWAILDDGYQTAIGDWTSLRADRYPEGLAAIAGRLRAAGKTPGLWLAPFCVGADSQLYAAHPDWVVKNASGGPQLVQRHWNTAIYGLDLTRAEVQAHLAALVHTLTRDWGFGVLKLDFLHFGAQPGVRLDATATPLDAYRDGLACIREAAGPDIHLLGCGAPLAPSLGLVDSMRVSPDVGLSWRGDTPANLSSVSTLHACMNTVHRLWQHGHWWINDPDCLIARSEAVHAPDVPPCVMTEAEKRFLATVVALSGGSMISGDGLAALDAAGWRRTGQLVPPSGLAARWVKGFKPEWPDLLDTRLATDWDAWRLFGLLNWDDAPRAIALPDDEDCWHFDVFAGAPCEATAALGAHDGRIVARRARRPHPWLVGDDRHFAQGLFGVEALSWDGEALAIALSPLPNREGQLWFAIPEGYAFDRVEGLLPDEQASVEDGWLRVRVRIEAPRGLRVCIPRSWV